MFLSKLFWVRFEFRFALRLLLLGLLSLCGDVALFKMMHSSFMQCVGYSCSYVSVDVSVGDVLALSDCPGPLSSSPYSGQDTKSALALAAVKPFIGH